MSVHILASSLARRVTSFEASAISLEQAMRSRLESPLENQDNYNMPSQHISNFTYINTSYKYIVHGKKRKDNRTLFDKTLILKQIDWNK